MTRQLVKEITRIEQFAEDQTEITVPVTDDTRELYYQLSKLGYGDTVDMIDAEKHVLTLFNIAYHVDNFNAKITFDRGIYHSRLKWENGLALMTIKSKLGIKTKPGGGGPKNQILPISSSRPGPVPGTIVAGSGITLQAGEVTTWVNRIKTDMEKDLYTNPDFDID